MAEGEGVQRSRGWVTWAAWGVFLVLLAGFVGGLIWQRKDDKRRVEAFEMAAPANRNLMLKFYARLYELHGGTWDEVEAKLQMKLTPIPGGRPGTRRTLVIDRESGYSWTLTFRDNGLFAIAV